MYGALKGAKVYTIYIDTQVGMAVLQFAERAGADTDFSQDLTAPEPMKSDMPSDIPKSRVLLSCVMDKTGALKNIRVLDSVKADVTARVMAAVQKWRFRPVLRGDDPVDVDAILGFNIDTADH
jgi:TonB family protein